MSESMPVAEKVAFSIKVKGTAKSGFKFLLGGIEQRNLEFKGDVSQDAARKIAEFVAKVLAEESQNPQ